MTNYKKHIIKELQEEIESTQKHNTFIMEQINMNLPKAFEENNIRISNLKELLRAIEKSESFSDPIFSYCNNEEEEYD